MSRELQTKRLLLKELTAKDAGLFMDFLLRNKEFFRPWSPEYDKDYENPEYHSKRLERSAAGSIDGSHYKFGVFYIDKPEKIIGSVSLSNIITGPFRSCFIGYRIDKNENGKGIASEAITSVVKFAFEELNLHRIEANIMPRNKPSIRAAEKCGFVYEGSSQKYLQINGVWEDHLHYVILNDQV